MQSEMAAFCFYLWICLTMFYDTSAEKPTILMVEVVRCNSHAYFEDGIVQDEDNPLLTKVQQ